MRAIPLAPSEWRGRLAAINKNDLTSKDYPNRNYVLLDVRNGEGSTVHKCINLYVWLYSINITSAHKYMLG